jgi:hypothetical protein
MQKRRSSDGDSSITCTVAKAQKFWTIFCIVLIEHIGDFKNGDVDYSYLKIFTEYALFFNLILFSIRYDANIYYRVHYKPFLFVLRTRREPGRKVYTMRTVARSVRGQNACRKAESDSLCQNRKDTMRNIILDEIIKY